MKQKLLTLLLATGCVILLVINYMTDAEKDDESPVITIEKEDITYTGGDDDTVLLKGVSAKDNVDGDITDQIFVDKIVLIDDNEAVVYYGVLDKSNNIGTAKRTVKYIETDETETELESENGAKPEQESADHSSDGPDQEYGVPQAEGSPDIQPDGVRPVMALITDTIRIKAGDSFDPLNVVWGVVDDVDTVDLLYQHISAEGEYDTQTPGTYEINFYVGDSDGNTSDPQIVTLIVE